MGYYVCKRCVMDNSSDDTIVFDENGFCNYCTDALLKIGRVYLPNEEGQRKLEKMIAAIKELGKNSKYDCLMGISGGLDSSYLAYLGSKWGLRILAIHIDDGYDTEITKQNLKKLSDAAKIELINVKPDREQYNDLLKAFLLAGVPNLAIPQDNILLAYLYKFARDNGIRFFLSGGNFALESILQKGNTYTAYDVVNTKAIHKRFGAKPIDKLLFISQFQRDIDKYLYRIETLRPLDYIDYNRDRALKELHDFCGFCYYGSKHLENKLTKFIQLYYFPNKFKVDKRRSHLSSMIVSGQMTRGQALEELKAPLYDENEMEKEIIEILKALEMARWELDKLMNEKPKQHIEYKTSKYESMRAFIKKIKRKIR